MSKTFLEMIYVGPRNEYVEEHWGGKFNGRIFYNGIEVATLSYCEDYHWAELYAAAPDLLEACKALVAMYATVAPCGDSPVVTAARAAIAKAEGCNHNEMVETNSATHAWKCAKCGYVYAKATT